MSSLHTSFIALLAATAVAPLSAITLDQFNTAFMQDFDALAAVTSGVMPPGWEFGETGSSANTTYGAGPGTSSTGNTYSFGATGSTDRALGSLRTSGVASTFGTVITNDTGATISSLTIQFTGEQWRLGALGRADRLDFGYSLDGTSLATGIWTEVDALDFTAPVTAGILGALDGNALENTSLISHTITGLSLTNGSSLWLRWADFDATGSDDGLAIDNFSILSARTVAGGGDDDAVQRVPESLPTSMVVAVFAGLMAIARRRATHGQ